jgi:HEAT repeat protein
MNANELRGIICKQEGVKLDFKREFYQIFHSSKDVSRRHWDELIRDILGLLNGNTGTQGQNGYLIIGVANQINSEGSRDLYDIGEVFIDSKQLLDRINPACEPPIADLKCEIVWLDDKRLLVITIPPSAHLHETTRTLETKDKKTYTERTVFIRRGESVLPATIPEILRILEEKKKFFSIESTNPNDIQTLIQDKENELFGSNSISNWIDNRSNNRLIRSKSIDNYLDNLIINFSGLETHYINLSGKTQSYTIQTNDLPKTLIPTSFRFIDFHSKTESESTTTTLESIEDALKIHQQFVLLGAPGSGKTRTLFKLQLDTAQKAYSNYNERVPIFIKLSHWQKDIKDVSEFIDYQCRLKGIRDLHFGRLLILLDGLNEMPANIYADRVNKIEDWIAANPTISIIITCRERDYREREKLSIPTVQISPLDEKRIQRFLQAYLGQEEGTKLLRLIRPDDVDRRSIRDLIHLAKNPFLLTMIVYVYKKKGTLPISRGELFLLFVKTLYGREEERGNTENLKYDDFIKGLSEVAFVMQRKRSATAVNLDWAIKYVPNHLSVSSLLSLGVHSTILELSEDDSVFQFSHQLLLEYFAAENLLGKHYNFKQYLKKPLFRGRKRLTGYWDEVLYTAVGINNANELLNEVSEIDPFLATDCLKYLPTNFELSKETIGKITNELISYFESDESNKREAAISKLIEMGDLALPSLLTIIKKGSLIGKRCCLKVFAESDDPLTIEALKIALNDQNRWVRKDALNIIGDLPSSIVEQIFIKVCLSLGGEEEISKEFFSVLVTAEYTENINILNCFIDTISDETIGDNVAKAVIMKGGFKVFKSITNSVVQHLEDNPQWVQKRLEAFLKLAAAFEQYLETRISPSPEVLDTYWLNELDLLLVDLDINSKTTAQKAISRMRDSTNRKLLLVSSREKEISTKPESSILNKKESINEVKSIKQVKVDLSEEEKEIQEMLKLLGSKSPSQGREAINALSALGEKSVNSVIFALNSRNPIVRRRAPRILANLGDRTCVKPLITLLRDPEPRVRKHALMALGKIEAKAVVENIDTLLLDEYNDVRLHAVMLLRRIGATNYEPLLIPLLEDTSLHVQIETAYTIAEWGNELGEQSLLKILINEQLSTNYRATACSRLGSLKSQKALDSIITLLTDGNKELRIVAAKALGMIGSTNAVIPLKEQLSNEDNNVRRAVIKALGVLGDSSVLELLIQALNDTDSSIRSCAVEALGVIRDHRAFLPISKLINDNDITVRRSVINSLKLLDYDQKALPLLNYMVNDADKQVSMDALNAIDKLKNKSAEIRD